MNLTHRLDQALRTHVVPGAAVGLLRNGETAIAVAGVASVRTDAPVTPDTLFPLGSVTKVYQATLLTSLGLDLDDTVKAHLPDFRVADPEATEQITLRHLLTHASGLDGDYVADFGRGDDAVARYVESCATLAQLYPPGLLTSYCNSAVVVGGRVVEVATGLPWHEALRTHLLEPNGLADTVALPEEAILRAVAVGHTRTAHGPAVSTTWSWPHAFGPAGGTLAASAGDVLAFARLHLAGGDVARAMQRFERAWPEGITPGLVGVGLGWMLADWDGRRVLAHGGSGMGAKSLLHVVPELDAAAVVLANSNAGGGALVADVMRAVFAEELGIAPPERAKPAPQPPDEERYTGTYRTSTSAFHVEVEDGALVVRTHSVAFEHAIPELVTERRPRQVGPDAFLAPNTVHPDLDIAFVFVDVDGDGRADYLYEGNRAYPRV